MFRPLLYWEGLQDRILKWVHNILSIVLFRFFHHQTLGVECRLESCVSRNAVLNQKPGQYLSIQGRQFFAHASSGLKLLKSYRLPNNVPMDLQVGDLEIQAEALWPHLLNGQYYHNSFRLGGFSYLSFVEYETMELNPSENNVLL